CGDLYFTTAPPACAKNHITIGALNSNDESMTSFSSWGPCDDGRIKPDISTAGCESGDDGGVTSCSSSGGYTTMCGTSMASPTACGIGALLIQDWRAQYPERADMANSTLKALLAHTAADLGNAGPDLQYGYGSIRTKAAVEHLRGDSHLEAEVSSGETFEFLVITYAGDEQLQITLAWDDEPAVPLVLPSLVNDLDLVVFAPDGTRQYPWAIDPANPGDPATRAAEDHLNNIEQVTVASPQAGVWRVQVAGYAVPVGPQAFSIMATPDLVACSSTGIVGLDRAAYPLEGELSVTVVDCDLNLDDTAIDTIDVLVRSDDEPVGEWLTLVEEAPAASTFSATMQHSVTDAVGVLYALHGSTIEVVYVDAEDAEGNINVDVSAAALVDGEAPDLEAVLITDVQPRSVHLTITPTEPAGLVVRYGTACDALNESVQRQGVVSEHDFTLGSLIDATTYYFDVTLVDAAGNESTFDNGGSCWSFTTPDVPDFFTEQFTSGVDLDGLSIRFDVSGGIEGYLACAEPIVTLPVDPAGGTTVSLGDDDATLITPDQSIVLYGESYSSLYIGSNGNLTFGAADTGYEESLSSHFGIARISALWDDLNPSAGGTISWKNLSGGVAVTWQNVPEYSSSNSNTFQVIMKWDGGIQMSWLGIDLADAIVGLSAGLGQDPDFEPTDLSAMGSACGPQPPTAHGQSLSMSPGGTLELTLTGSDDGLPNPPGMLTFIIDTLPSQVLVDLDTGASIGPDDLPYVPGNSAHPNLSYVPMNGWEGIDSFSFHADDGGAAPDGGPSAAAMVNITVADGPEIVYSFPMDSDPGWAREGQWDFGQPTGAGGSHGFPDPTTGATGVA
ncbi:MAG: S8 family serine peptidase, partial [Phycisphaerae bacterium]|nr:S8 family serine peptidase [Phycisphaerae bacterium]